MIYRWDWIDRRVDPDFDPDEGKLPEELIFTCANTRRGVTFHVTCPISKEQEPEVLEFLRGPRVLGALQQMWAPLLDHFPAAAPPFSPA